MQNFFFQNNVLDAFAIGFSVKELHPDLQSDASQDIPMGIDESKLTKMVSFVISLL